MIEQLPKHVLVTVIIVLKPDSHVLLQAWSYRSVRAGGVKCYHLHSGAACCKGNSGEQRKKGKIKFSKTERDFQM